MVREKVYNDRDRLYQRMLSKKERKYFCQNVTEYAGRSDRYIINEMARVSACVSKKEREKCLKDINKMLGMEECQSLPAQRRIEACRCAVEAGNQLSNPRDFRRDDYRERRPNRLLRLLFLLFVFRGLTDRR